MSDNSFPIFLAPFILFVLGIAVFIIAAQWRVFEKAKQPGWACIIPIYNIYVMTRIAGKPGWWTIMCLLPLVNLIFIIWLYNMISKSFGKDEAFTVGLFLLGFVFWPILGFGKSVYLGPYGDPVAFSQYNKPSFDFEGKQTQQ